MGIIRETGGGIAMIAALTRWALAGIFVYAGIAKVLNPQSFATSIARFQIVPEVVIHPMALGLPVLEILCGVALLAGPWRRQAAFSVVTLCAVFLAALISASVRGITIECTCFGAPTPEPIWRAIVRDLVFLVMALVTYAKALQPPRPQFVRYATPISALNETY